MRIDTSARQKLKGEIKLYDPTSLRRQRRRRRDERKKTIIAVILMVSLMVAIMILVSSVIANKPSRLRTATGFIGEIPVYEDFLPVGTNARPGTERRILYLVIHETGNIGKNANADAHNRYLHDQAEVQSKSWHYTVDDQEIYYHVPDDEIAFHAGDGLRQRGGNLNGIGIEMCVNPESNDEKTLENTAKLSAYLLNAYGLSVQEVKTHQDFSGKICPENLLNRQGWEEFLSLVQKELDSLVAV